MGLADWWLARTEANGSNTAVTSPTAKKTATTPSKPKWPLIGALKLTRSKSESNHRKCLPLNASKPTGLCVNVGHAKELLHQYTSAVSLYPSLVHTTLTLPSKLSLITSSVPVEKPVPVPVQKSTPLNPEIEVLEQEIASLEGLELRMTSDGCGGAYMVTSSGSSSPIAIFKPRDEEYMAPKNPRGYVQEHAVVGETEHPVNKGFRVGNGALRERAAFLLDAAYGHFSGVPVTTVLSLPVRDGGEHKEGSIQRFVTSECSAEDMGTLNFSIPEVHKIGILDVRLFNTDRHAGNILLQRSTVGQTYAMTPIDHGFCLPSYKHLDGATFDWLHWSQAQYPFTCGELDHIAALDATRDASLLRSLGIEEECITTMRICTSLLKIGADEGFSLFEIGSCLQRDGDFSEPSPLEKVVTGAVATVQETVKDETSIEFMDALVAQVETAVIEMFTQLPKKKVRSISCFS